MTYAIYSCHQLLVVLPDLEGALAGVVEPLNLNTMGVDLLDSRKAVQKVYERVSKGYYLQLNHHSCYFCNTSRALQYLITHVTHKG